MKRLGRWDGVNARQALCVCVCVWDDAVSRSEGELAAVVLRASCFTWHHVEAGYGGVVAAASDES